MPGTLAPALLVMCLSVMLAVGEGRDKPASALDERGAASKRLQASLSVGSLKVLDGEWDEALLDSVQHRTFNYFWDGAEPTSGLARERYHVDGE